MAEHGVKDGRWRKPTKGITQPLPDGHQVRKDSRFHGGRIKGTSVAGELEPVKAPALPKPPSPPLLPKTPPSQPTRPERATPLRINK